MRIKQKIYDPGFGTSASNKQQRIMNKDGSFNVTHLNREIQFRDMYIYLLNISWSKFFLITLFSYLTINFIFGFIYYFFGVENLGMPILSFSDDFLHCFFFSTQTFTTIGYGAIAPKSHAVSSVAAIEGFVGLLFFAFASGLFYGRFSRPTPNLTFSKNFIIRQHNDSKALMFKLMHKHPNVILNVIEETILVIKKDENEKTNYSYYPLKMERERLVFLPYTWTIVHNITENSPLYNYTDEELEKLDAEILIAVNYFDDTFPQTIYQRHSYTFNEMKINNKFDANFYFDSEGNALLDHNKMNKLLQI